MIHEKKLISRTSLKFKNFHSVKDVKKMRKQATKLENIFTKRHIWQRNAVQNILKTQENKGKRVRN